MCVSGGAQDFRDHTMDTDLSSWVSTLHLVSFSILYSDWKTILKTAIFHNMDMPFPYY